MGLLIVFATQLASYAASRSALRRFGMPHTTTPVVIALLTGTLMGMAMLKPAFQKIEDREMAQAEARAMASGDPRQVLVVQILKEHDRTFAHRMAEYLGLWTAGAALAVPGAVVVAIDGYRRKRKEIRAAAAHPQDDAANRSGEEDCLACRRGVPRGGNPYAAGNTDSPDATLAAYWDRGYAAEESSRQCGGSRD